MQFGMFDEVNAVAGRTPAQVYDDHLRQIVLSEELGFTSYWFAEHHFDTYRMAPHPNLLLPAAPPRPPLVVRGGGAGAGPVANAAPAALGRRPERAQRALDRGAGTPLRDDLPDARGVRPDGQPVSRRVPALAAIRRALRRHLPP